MSGTSADGVDVAIVEVSGRGLAMTAKPLSHAYEPFPADLRKQILDVRQRGEVPLADLAAIGRRVTLAHVPAFLSACAKANVTADQVAAISAHGQTLYHGPPNTIQYFDPSLLAYETGCAIVSDFRRADLAAGGQGAPLVPFADWILFRHPTKSRVILNIGGIANITYLKAGGSIDEVIAFDTGPGNCLSDWAIREYFPHLPGFDGGGDIAFQGEWLPELYEPFLQNDFFRKPPPRSTDGPEMIDAFRKLLPLRNVPVNVDDEDIGPQSIVMTAAYLVGATVWDAIPMTGDWPDELIVAGGGTKNNSIMGFVASDKWRRTTRVLTSDELGIATDAREPIAFALLGAATLDGEPSNVPSATGASRRVVLGSITPRPHHFVARASGT